MRSLFLPLIGFVLLLGSYALSQSKDKSDGSPTIRVDVEMVSLPVVVSTREGKRVSDLKQEDFLVFENGVQQEIAGFAATDEPLKIVLLLDTSGSAKAELAKIQNAAINFVNQLHPDDEVAVMSFAEDTTLQQDFSINREKNEYGIKKTRTGECTVEYEAVWLALEEMLKPVQERKALVIFTDGVDTCSRKSSRKETLDLAQETRATIYCVYYNTEFDQYRTTTPGRLPSSLPQIIIGPSSQPPVSGGPGWQTGDADYALGREYLAKLAEYSGGLVFDGMKDLRTAFAEIAKELANQYSLGYYSSISKRDGKFRKVEVKVTRPGLVVRTKKGYYAR
jgi:Ca-activated chloride channel homolog